jgi:hypothetical protein
LLYLRIKNLCYIVFFFLRESYDYGPSSKNKVGRAVLKMHQVEEFRSNYWAPFGGGRCDSNWDLEGKADRVFFSFLPPRENVWKRNLNFKLWK